MLFLVYLLGSCISLNKYFSLKNQQRKPTISSCALQIKLGILHHCNNNCACAINQLMTIVCLFKRKQRLHAVNQRHQSLDQTTVIKILTRSKPALLIASRSVEKSLFIEYIIVVSTLPLGGFKNCLKNKFQFTYILSTKHA